MTLSPCCPRAPTSQYVLLTMLLLLPATKPCVDFCVRCLGWRRQAHREGAAGWWRPRRGRCVFVALLLIVAVQALNAPPPPYPSCPHAESPAARAGAQLGVVWQLHTATLTSREVGHLDSPAILLVPLLLPGITAVDLVVDRRGSRGERVAAAALTLLTPLFWLLELRRLQATPMSTTSLEAPWEDRAVPCAATLP